MRCNQKKGVERRISYVEVICSKKTNSWKSKTPLFQKTYIIKTANPVLLEIPLVLLICQNKVQCSMCELPIGTYMVISH